MHKRQFHFIFVVYHMQQFELYHILMIIHFMIYFHEYNRLNIIFCTCFISAVLFCRALGLI